MNITITAYAKKCDGNIRWSAFRAFLSRHSDVHTRYRFGPRHDRVTFALSLNPKTIAALQEHVALWAGAFFTPTTRVRIHSTAPGVNRREDWFEGTDLWEEPQNGFFWRIAQITRLAISRVIRIVLPEVAR